MHGQKKDANEHFKKGLLEQNIINYEIKSHDDVDFTFIETLLVPQQKTCQALLNSEINLDSNFVNARQSVISTRNSLVSGGENKSRAYGVKDDKGNLILQLNDLDSYYIEMR